MALRSCCAAVIATLFSGSVALAQRVTPPVLDLTRHHANDAVGPANVWEKAAGPHAEASGTSLLATADSGPSTWTTVRDFFFLEAGIAALSSFGYWSPKPESAAESIGGVLIFLGFVDYMFLTENPCASTTAPSLQLIAAALVLVGGYDVFLGYNRHPTNDELFRTNEIALNLVSIASWGLYRRVGSSRHPCTGSR